MAAEAEAVKDRIGSITGNKIQVKQNKTFVLPDGSVVDNFVGIIVEFTNRNLFYSSAYNESSIEPPDCYAVNPIMASMAPAENAPEKQAESCAECPNNAFGSLGKGKACKNSRRLALLPPDDDGTGTLMTLDVSPTAIKRFDKMVSDVRRDFNMLPIGIQVEFSFAEHVEYASLEFTIVDKNENLPYHWGRRGEAADMLNQLVDYSAFEAQAAPASKRKPAGRRAVRR
jgi:hypothetical protein